VRHRRICQVCRRKSADACLNFGKYLEMGIQRATIAPAALALPFNTAASICRWTFGGPGRMRNLAILAALALAGCSIGGLNAGRNNFKGQPLSAVTAKLGPPEYQETIEGQKAYTWSEGQSLFPCHIRVIMAGDVVDSYETAGDPSICSQYDTR